MTRVFGHLCHAKGCTKEVNPRFFMCPKHWYMVPDKMKRKIYKHYVPGQEVRKDPTDKYLKWALRAVEHVYRREQAA